MMRPRAWALCLPLLLACARTTPADRMLPQSAYVWQRSWTPAVEDAVARTAPLVAGFSVLVAEWGTDGTVIHAAVDWPALLRSGRPVSAVLRIDGSRGLPAPASVAAAIPAWPALAGIEIDFDCPTRRLPEYRRFLVALRPMLPPGARLSITILPDWLRSSGLTPLTRVVDRSVLQVHATDDPRLGLFDADRMLAAAGRMSELSATPFLVSLPTYGVRVVLEPDGRLRATEAERSLLIGASGRELEVLPDEMERAVAALDRDPPFRLAGVIWFRVPSRDDKRSWSLESWIAVLRHEPATAAPLLRRDPGTPTLLRLVNPSGLDAGLPDRILLDPGCTEADGAGPYRRRGSFLERIDGRMLPGHAALVVGWERCPERPGQLESGLP